MKTREIILLACVLVVLLCVAWAARWDVTPISSGDGFGGAYKLNRWTGSLYLIHGPRQLEVTPAQ